MSKPYNPLYDPLTDPTPGEGVGYAPTYWVDSAGEPPPLDGPIDSDRETDVAIIGSGLTGLAAAYFLARDHGIKATALEANTLAWGCTSRNGGQGQLACGRLSLSQWAQRWGEETAARLFADVREGFEEFRALAYDPAIACEPQGDGHLLLAHQRSWLPRLEREARLHNRLFGYHSRVLDGAALRDRYINDRDAHGALFEPEGIGVHPMKLSFGYARKSRALGATIHPASAVIDWQWRNGRHRLHTAGGVVAADKVIIATGGYTGTALHPALRYRTMPILSNSVVTRPLNSDELDACGIKTKLVVTDTRRLRFYYRLLPDNRMQIGTRSAITGRDAAARRHYDLLIGGLHAKFPPLREVPTAYSWWGWVDVSHDMMPRIFAADDKNTLFYALGYGGNGVAFSAHAGLRLAQMVAGHPAPDLPIYTSPLPKHPLTPFRRLGQRLLYRYYHLLDLLP